jgi:PBP1b-binding outer membrane lipoprotein LpoB
MTKVKLLKAMISIALVIFISGCLGSKINEENYKKVQEGMTMEQVKAILGEPTDASTKGVSIPMAGSLSGTLATWKSSDGKITIELTFVNDKVKLKTYNAQ